MQLKVLLHNIISLKEDQDCDIRGITQDSRTVQPGDLFLAYPGAQHDGRDYILEAIEKGAVAILMEQTPSSHELSVAESTFILQKKDLIQSISEIAARFYQYPSWNMLLIGVTGTNGKSSCTHFMAASLAQAGKKCGIIGGITCGIYTPSLEGAVFRDLKQSHLTTPDAIELQRLLAQFRDQGVSIAVLEVSSHGLAQGRVQSLSFTIAAFTNLTHDHLDYHDTLEAYAETKQKLFKQSIKYAIFNQDDAYGLRWFERFSESLPAVYGYTVNSAHCMGPQLNTLQAHVVQADINQLRAQIVTPWGEGLLFNQNLIGTFNISNLLLVLTVLGILEVPLKQSLSIINQLKPIIGRMEKIHQMSQQPLVVIDYAHTPDALQKALKALQSPEGKLWCVFGCGGNRDQTKRPLMGAIAEKYADQVIVTQDNPRDEKSEDIIQAILSGMQNPHVIWVEKDRAQAISRAIQCSQPKDTILIAGKGHETSQIIQSLCYHFSDHQVVQAALSDLGAIESI